MRIFTLLCIVALTLFAAKLTKSGAYVIDDQNKLIWQDTKDNLSLLLTQDEAIEYCKKLTLSSFSDWKLPSIEEYKTIINKKRIASQAQIDKAFKYVKQDNYWASDRTWARNFGLYGYYVYFKSGTIYYPGGVEVMSHIGNGG